ncbi:alpha-ribazole phosphatase [Haloimpatiens sp. FM7315]|uniref:alpha-ribazole phosphatase n=1 Tax=Haloimpatiens sp. FM7315 TaxID=3298609 RepID=UPI00370BBFFD
MNIYFIRHGETLENEKSTYYGNLNVGLNKKGVSQITKWATFFENKTINKVYISDTKRARETSAIILKKQSDLVFTDVRLNERNFGDFEGKTYEDILKFYPEKAKDWKNDWKNFRPPNGETFMEMYKRVCDFMEDLKKANYNNVLIITHSGVIKGALCYIMDNNPDLFWKFSCKNGDRILVKLEYDNLFLDSITHVD